MLQTHKIQEDKHMKADQSTDSRTDQLNAHGLTKQIKAIRSTASPRRLERLNAHSVEETTVRKQIQAQSEHVNKWPQHPLKLSTILFAPSGR